MPVYIAAQGLFEGLGTIPYIWTVLKTLPWLFLVYLLKRYLGGATNGSERLMHSKVVMMTVRSPSQRTAYMLIASPGRDVRHWRCNCTRSCRERSTAGAADPASAD